MDSSTYLLLIHISRYDMSGRFRDSAILDSRLVAIWKEALPDDKVGRPNPRGPEGLYTSDQHLTYGSQEQF